MNNAQTRLYRAEWSKCRKALRRFGRSPSKADAERYRIHERVTGSACSSKALSNKQLTHVLTIFWTWSEASNLNLQLRPDTEAATMARFACGKIYDLISEICQIADMTENTSISHLPAYLDGIFHKLNAKDKKKPVDTDYGTPAQWHKVMLSSCYRYDQIARKAIGLGGNKDKGRFWPYRHEKNLQEIRHYQACNSGNPF